MVWEEVAAPSVTPVSVDEAKQWARVQSGNEEDGMIELAIKAAVRRLESETRRAFITRGFKAYLDEFPSWDEAEIELPVAKLQSVASVKYYDANGVLQTWASSNYTVDVKREPGRIVRGLGVAWPVTQSNRPNAVEVEFTAGYGAQAAAVPEGIRTLILELVAHWYNHREPVTMTASSIEMVEIPLTFEYLLSGYRIHQVV